MFGANTRRRPVAMELGSGNAPNFSKLLHPVLQGQQLSCRAGISLESLVTSNYSLCQGGQRGKLESAPCRGIPCTQRSLSAEMPAGDEGFCSIAVPTLKQDLGHTQMRLPLQHLQPPGRTSNPRIVGISAAQHVRTHSSFPSHSIAISGQLLKPQVPGNSLQPYKQHQACWRQPHSQLLKEKHKSSEDA